MDTQTFRKFCPICKLGNEMDAVVCRHCGAKMGDGFSAPTTRKVDDPFELTEEIKEQIIRDQTPPSRGLTLFLLNRSEPIALCLKEEFVLGRAGEVNTQEIVDLTDFDGFAMGVSRRHALIRASGEKYVLVDLNSSNGTWIDGQRLVPTRPYDLPSGGTIQLGRMRLVVTYLKPVVSKKQQE